MITKRNIDEAMSYEHYRQLLESLLAQGKTTGLNQSPEYLDYAKINLQRMARIEKTTSLSDALMNKLRQLRGHYIWLVITEGWCGDASQNLPPIHLIEKNCPAIELKLLLRDEHPELMNQYLTNGSRSIPKLICLEKETLKELFVWGPRPASLQQLVVEMVGKGIAKADRGIETQKWYNLDKTQSLQGELLNLINSYMI